MARAAQTLEQLGRTAPGPAAGRSTNDTAADEPRLDVDCAASAIVSAPAGEVFAFLTDLENHWLVADRFVEVITLDGPAGGRSGGLVALRGPLGLRRTVRTRVLTAIEPSYMAGTAEIGARTVATVRWSLDGHGPHSRVVLTATVETAGILDRILLSAGGRWWLRRRFGATLDRLAAHFSDPSGGGGEASV